VLEGKRYLVAGFIAYYPTYFKVGGGDEVTVPDHVKGLYQEVRKLIGGMATCYPTVSGHQHFWVSPNACNLLVKGEATTVLDLNLD
jgi:hypothetical protein